MENRGRLRLVKNDPAPDQEGEPQGGPAADKDAPLSWGVSLAVWGVMAVLAWVVVAAVLHFL